MNYDAGLLSQLKAVDFGDNVELITNKIIASEISTYNYISTENMLPNCGGVTNASSLPAANKFNAFCETDTLFSNIRTYFRKVWFADFSGGASADVLIFRTKNSSILDPHFLYYVVSNKTFVDYTDLTSKGAKMPRGDKDAIIKFPLKLPPISEQKAIASVLGALDDKIKNNRRMNETLEEMARAIFKSWFVDFDPVHAKAAGAAPAHMDADAAALFPSSFGDDGLPAGWSEGAMSETVMLIGGGTPKTKEASYWGGDINWFSVVDAPSTSDVWVIDTQKKITKLGLDNSSAKLLPPKTTIISARGTVGKTALTLSEISMNQSCYGVVGTAGYSSFYTYFSVRKMVSELQANAHGSVFDTITTDTFSSVTVTKPPTEVSDRFDKLVETMLSKISNNLRENQTLAELRDTLLPKLMSGEMRVADAEREVEAAV